MLEQAQIEGIRCLVNARREDGFKTLCLCHIGLINKLREKLKREGDYESLDWISKMIYLTLN